jgi:hypothetical protein
MLSLTLTQVKNFVEEKLITACKPDRFILYSHVDELDQSLKPIGIEISDINGFIASSTKKY